MTDTLCPVCRTPLERVDDGWLCTTDPDDPQLMTDTQLAEAGHVQALVRQVAAGRPLADAITDLSEVTR